MDKELEEAQELTQENLLDMLEKGRPAAVDWPPREAIRLVQQYVAEAKAYGIEPYDYLTAQRALLEQLFGIRAAGEAITKVIGHKLP